MPEILANSSDSQISRIWISDSEGNNSERDNRRSETHRFRVTREVINRER